MKKNTLNANASRSGRTTMMGWLVFAISTLFSVGAFAGPDQIEVIGLVPGKSTEAEVQGIKSDTGFIIGG